MHVHIFNVVDTALRYLRALSVCLLISLGIFQGKKKVVCMKSEMQILHFYLAGQIYLYNFLKITAMSWNAKIVHTTILHWHGELSLCSACPNRIKTTCWLVKRKILSFIDPIRKNVRKLSLVKVMDISKPFLWLV